MATNHPHVSQRRRNQEQRKREKEAAKREERRKSLREGMTEKYRDRISTEMVKF